MEHELAALKTKHENNMLNKWIFIISDTKNKSQPMQRYPAYIKQQEEATKQVRANKDKLWQPYCHIVLKQGPRIVSHK